MRTLAAFVLTAAFALGGCGGTAPSVRHRDGIAYTLPAGWHVASRSLTPHLTDPRELFTAGTGRLATGSGACAHVPSAALAAMGPGDVLVSVLERHGPGEPFAARPRRFALRQSLPSEADQCAGPRPAFASHLFGFRSAGRRFYALVAVGRRASRARVRDALALLDSLRIG